MLFSYTKTKFGVNSIATQLDLQGPVSSETNVTVNRNGSTDNTGGVARVLTDDSGLGSSGGGGGGGENGTSGSISRHSTTDDESWMYNDVSYIVTATVNVNHHNFLHCIKECAF